VSVCLWALDVISCGQMAMRVLLQCVAVRYSMLQCVAVSVCLCVCVSMCIRCNTVWADGEVSLVAVCCSVLQCVAVCCRVRVSVCECVLVAKLCV